MKKNWTNFIGGISINERVGPEGSYFQGFGIDPLKEPNILKTGEIGSGEGTSLLDGGGVVMHEGWVFHDDGLANYEIDNISGTGTAHSFGPGSGGTEVIDLQKTTESGSDFLYYSYVNGSTAEVGRASADNRDLTSEDDDWYSNVAGGSLSGTNPLLMRSDDVLYICDGNTVDEWITSSSTLTEAKLDLPNNIVFIGKHSGYVVFITNQDDVFLWDGQSISWNYRINLDGVRFVTGASKNGRFYFLTTSTTDVDHATASSNFISAENLEINTIGQNFRSYRSLYPINIERESNSQNVYFDSVSLKGGVYFLISEEQVDSNSDTYLNIVRYGSNAGLDDILTIPHVSTPGDSQGSKQGFMYYSDTFYFGATTDVGNDTHEVFEVNFNSESGNAVDSTEFQTNEFDITTQEEDFFVGIGEDIQVLINESPDGSGVDKSSKTVITPVLDGTEATDLEYVADGNELNRITFSLNEREFTKFSLKIKNFVPSVRSISLQYRLKQVR